MALNFPTPPSDGQIYTDVTTGRSYKYVGSLGVWELQGGNSAPVFITTKPLNPKEGQIFYDPATDTLEVYTESTATWEPASSAATKAKTEELGVVYGYQDPDDSSNVFYGYSAGTLSEYNQVNGTGTYGFQNTAIGENSFINGTGSSNVSIGYSALENSIGSNNVAVGSDSLSGVTSGNNNIGVGPDSGKAIVDGVNNVIIGSVSGSPSLQSNIIIAAGTDVGIQINENNAYGVPTGTFGQTVDYGTAGYVLTSQGSTAPPQWAAAGGGGGGAVAAAKPQVLGTVYGYQDPDNSSNSYHGYESGLVSQYNQENAITPFGSYNTAVGQNSFDSATGNNNVAVGYFSLLVTTGNDNVAVGYSALSNLSSGGSNIGIGYEAGKNISSGSNNTLIGKVPGTTNLNSNIIIAAGADVGIQINENNAYGIPTATTGTTVDYGTAGYVLTSQGSTAPPTWSAVAGGGGGSGEVNFTVTSPINYTGSGALLNYDQAQVRAEFDYGFGVRRFHASAGKDQPTTAAVETVNYFNFFGDADSSAAAITYQCTGTSAIAGDTIEVVDVGNSASIRNITVSLSNFTFMDGTTSKSITTDGGRFYARWSTQINAFYYQIT